MTHTLDVAASTLSLGGWEEVPTADHGIRYARFGAEFGTPVIMLLAGTTNSNVWPELFETLARSRPMYLPDLPDGELSFAPRMREFLDGLGLRKVTLVAPGGFCLPAIELARREPGRFAGLVLVPTSYGEERALSQVISITDVADVVRVLV